MNRTCSAQGSTLEKPEWNLQVGRSKHRWENNIKM